MIIVRLQAENFCTRWNCCFCNGYTEKHSVCAIAFRDDGTELGHVCETCIETGPTALKQRAIEAAEECQTAANRQREFADSLEIASLPTMAEWNQAEEQYDKWRFDETKTEVDPDLPEIHDPLDVNGKSVPVILGK